MVTSLLRFGVFLLLAFVFFAVVPPGVMNAQAQQMAATEGAAASERSMILFRADQVRLVDTRTPYERARRSIPGTLAIPFGPQAWDDGIADYDRERFLATVKAAGLKPDDSIVLMCDSGIRSLAAARFLLSMGYLNVQTVSSASVDPRSGEGF